MSWESVSNVMTKALDIKKEKVGYMVEGTYLSSKEITTKLGNQIVWKFDGEDGEFEVYGFSNLNRAMSSMKIGTLLRITYEGTQKGQTKYGMKDIHQVRVEKWVGEEDKSKKDIPSWGETSSNPNDMPF